MQENVAPNKFQQVVKSGFRRLRTYRAARAMFIKAYVGQYFRTQKGITGDEPINLIFQALRVFVPNLVMKNPVNKVTTEIISHKPYAELLSFALNSLQKQIKLKGTLRAGIVDANFGLGVFKTSIASSDGLVTIDDIDVDPGQIYTDRIDLDNLTFDPVCTTLSKSSFIGHRTRIPRQLLLDYDDFDSDVVMRLPVSQNILGGIDKPVERFTKDQLVDIHARELQDYVDVVECWVADANAIVLIPDPYQLMTDKFIGVRDYYGPKEGPYSFLSFTPPVPNNPLPVAPVGIWYDLHNIANDVFKKVMNQAVRQKDVGLYRPAMADVAQAIENSVDGDWLACEDPAAINKISVGGANPKNQEMVQQLQFWFNYIAGNPDQLGGQKSDVPTATQAEIIQANANVGVGDMRDAVYDAAADIAHKQAWFLHNDPLIDMPFTKRQTGGEEIQLQLTPEQRQGTFLEYAFRIVKKSMSALDPAIRAKRIMEFATNVVPGAAAAAQICNQMGVAFNFPVYLTKLAEELDIDELMSDVFNDPTFMQRMELMAKLGPQSAGKNPLTTKGVMQNQGSPIKRNVPTPGQEVNQARQEPGAISQSARRIV